MNRPRLGVLAVVLSLVVLIIAVVFHSTRSDKPKLRSNVRTIAPENQKVAGSSLPSFQDHPERNETIALVHEFIKQQRQQASSNEAKPLRETFKERRDDLLEFMTSYTWQRTDLIQAIEALRLLGERHRGTVTALAGLLKRKDLHRSVRDKTSEAIGELLPQDWKGWQEDAPVEEEPHQPTPKDPSPDSFPDFDRLKRLLDQITTRPLPEGRDFVHRRVRSLTLKGRNTISKDPEEAIRAFTQALELDPKSLHAYLGRAVAYSTARHHELAKADLLHASSLYQGIASQEPIWLESLTEGLLDDLVLYALDLTRRNDGQLALILADMTLSLIADRLIREELGSRALLESLDALASCEKLAAQLDTSAEPEDLETLVSRIGTSFERLGTRLTTHERTWTTIAQELDSLRQTEGFDSAYEPRAQALEIIYKAHDHYTQMHVRLEESPRVGSDHLDHIFHLRVMALESKRLLW